MKKLWQVVSVLLVVVGSVLLFERPAYAYADPGTGLLAIQAVGSALVATGWYLRRKIYSLLHGGASTRLQSNEQPAAKDDGKSALT